MKFNWIGRTAASANVPVLFLALYWKGLTPRGATYGILTGLIATIVLIYPSIVLYAKRWHDRGKSGWWTLILLVPVIGGLWMLIECGFLRGTDGPNRFGADPLRG